MEGRGWRVFWTLWWRVHPSRGTALHPGRRKVAGAGRQLFWWMKIAGITLLQLFWWLKRVTLKDSLVSLAHKDNRKLLETPFFGVIE